MAQGELHSARVPLRAKLLAESSRESALSHLSSDSLRNLLLIDLVDQVGRAPSPSELVPQVLGAFESPDGVDGVDQGLGWYGSEAEAVCGVAALRPSLVLEAGLDGQALDAFLPYLQTIESGLVKSAREVVDRLCFRWWTRLTIL